MSHLAVSLDTSRQLLERVLDEPEATATRRGIAKARAEIALETWRESVTSTAAPRHH